MESLGSIRLGRRAVAADATELFLSAAGKRQLQIVAVTGCGCCYNVCVALEASPGCPDLCSSLGLVVNFHSGHHHDAVWATLLCPLCCDHGVAGCDGNGSPLPLFVQESRKPVGLVAVVGFISSTSISNDAAHHDVDGECECLYDIKNA